MERVSQTYSLVGISSLKLLDLAHLDLTVTLLQLTINLKAQYQAQPYTNIKFSGFTNIDAMLLCFTL